MKIKNTSIYIEQDQPSNFSADAIVSPVSSGKNNGTVSVIQHLQDGSIKVHDVESNEVQEGNAYFNKTEEGDFQYLIFPVVFDPSNNTFQGFLRNSICQTLQIADYLKIKSLVIPSLINNPKKIPVVGEAKIIIQEILKFLKAKETSIDKIVFCLSKKTTYNIFHDTILGYVSHIQDTLGDGPYVTVDVIIELDEGIILIERSNPPYGWALPGGFVDYGESLEVAVTREAKEETNMELEELKQFHVYSDPDRDPRFHTVSTVFIAKGKGTPAFGDDAKGLKIVKYENLLNLEYAFDHYKIIQDYLKKRNG